MDTLPSREEAGLPPSEGPQPSRRVEATKSREATPRSSAGLEGPSEVVSSGFRAIQEPTLGSTVGLPPSEDSPAWPEARSEGPFPITVGRVPASTPSLRGTPDGASSRTAFRGPEGDWPPPSWWNERPRWWWVLLPRTYFAARAPSMLDEIRSEASGRRLTGVIVGTVGVAFVVGVLVTSGRGFERMAVPANREHLWFSMALVLGHTAITVAAIYFGYSMLRVAERMFVPRRLFDPENERGVEVIRAILGVNAPSKVAVEEAKTFLKEVRDAAQAVSSMGASKTDSSRD